MFLLEDEPCFDNDLEKISRHEVYGHLPKVLVECIGLLERNSDYMQTSGLYRVSGNHTIIQRLRFKVNFRFNNHNRIFIVSINFTYRTTICINSGAFQ